MAVVSVVEAPVHFIVDLAGAGVVVSALLVAVTSLVAVAIGVVVVVNSVDATVFVDVTGLSVVMLVSSGVVVVGLVEWDEIHSF